MKKTVLALLLVVAAFTSCKKTPPTRTELLIGRWLRTAQVTEYAVAGFSTRRDDYGALSECQRDNMVLYERGGTYSIDENTINCNYGGPQVMVVGNWYISEPDGALVQQDIGESARPVSILLLDGTSLKTSRTDSVSVGLLRYRAQTTTTYRRQ